MGSPLSPIVANLHIEEVESRALGSFKGIMTHGFRNVDDTSVNIKTQEVEIFTEHLDSVDCNIKFTRKDMKENRLPLLDCDIHLEKDIGLSIEVYRKPTHTDQYLLFNLQHYLENMLGVNRTLHHQAENVPTKTDGKNKERKCIMITLKFC